MESIRDFFSRVARDPSLMDKFVQIMGTLEPSETEQMAEKLACFAKESGYGDAGTEIADFFNNEATADYKMTNRIWEDQLIR